MKIIAVGGLAQAGKTTAVQAAAQYLFEKGYHPVLEQFARPLKLAAASLGFYKGGDTDHLYRWFCQTIGQKCRAIDPDWVPKRLADRLDVLAQEESDELLIDEDATWSERVVLIDDVRYMNELALIEKYSGKTMFISAARRLPTLDEEDWRKHDSEVLATKYENGLIPDETFNITLSNNEEGGQEAFEAICMTVAHSLVCDAREE